MGPRLLRDWKTAFFIIDFMHIFSAFWLFFFIWTINWCLSKINSEHIPHFYPCSLSCTSFGQQDVSMGAHVLPVRHCIACSAPNSPLINLHGSQQLHRPRPLWQASAAVNPRNCSRYSIFAEGLSLYVSLIYFHPAQKISNTSFTMKLAVTRDEIMKNNC